MTEQEAGRWLVWGDGPSADVQADAWKDIESALASVFSGMEPARLDDDPAADPPVDSGTTAVMPDCGEGDLFDDVDEDTELIALIHERDPEWTPPGHVDPEDPSGRISWMEVVNNATEREIHAKVAAHSTAVRGFVRLA